MEKDMKKELIKFATEIRKNIIISTYYAKSGHPGGSLSCADYIAYLYMHELRIDLQNVQDEERDRFVLSKGHAAPALYAALAQKGFFPVEDLKTLRKKGSYLQGHPNMNSVPGCDMTSGSLGQGISAACGMAKGAKILDKDINVYTLLGDGECAEGQVWEAILFASHYKLDNLCIAVDVNGLQIDGSTEEVMNTSPLKEKFKAFGCNVVSADGHSFDDLEKAFSSFHRCIGCPTVILLNTIKGKGVSFMENSVDWHGKAPNKEEMTEALRELEEEMKWKLKE